MPRSLAPGPCGRCLQHAPPQQQTRSLYVYQGPVRMALLAWKLQGDHAALDWLMQTSSPALKLMFSPDDLLIPVPMPIKRMRQSGLHHSADLCKSISHIVGCKMDWRMLRRTGNHTRQSALTGQARKNNLRKGFALNSNHHPMFEAHKIKGTIWVVDDIFTTGATLRHACQTMRQGKHSICAFAFARTSHHE